MVIQREESKDWLALEEESREKLQAQRENSSMMFGPESSFRMKWDLTQVKCVQLAPWCWPHAGHTCLHLHFILV